MTLLRDIPEVAALHASQAVVRIPPETDVPLTRRVQRIVDSAPFRRLSQVSQLGLVRLVYPAAHHTRFEHSLGVYRTALLFLDRLAADERFAAIVTVRDAETFLVAALLHDIGHWPYCHPMEDLALADLPEHEALAAGSLNGGELASLLADDWGLAPAKIVELLDGAPATAGGRMLASLLSGPIDVDKMDYLMRDSLHAGVPYGRNFDQQRLIHSLCVSESGDQLAITDKGKTAAEMMVFARYVMFSEVYWHHAVRSATAMLQRAFYSLWTEGRLDAASLFTKSEHEFEQTLLTAAAGSPAPQPLLNSLFGERRALYKRIAQWSVLESPEAFAQLARRPYPWLVELAGRFAGELSAVLGQTVAPHDVLFDAPPMALEVEFDIDVHFAKERKFRRLGDVSPVVRTLAKRQFDDYVKRVRLFAHPRVAARLLESTAWRPMFAAALASMDADPAAGETRVV